MVFGLLSRVQNDFVSLRSFVCVSQIMSQWLEILVVTIAEDEVRSPESIRVVSGQVSAALGS